MLFDALVTELSNKSGPELASAFLIWDCTVFQIIIKSMQICCWDLCFVFQYEGQNLDGSKFKIVHIMNSTNNVIWLKMQVEAKMWRRGGPDPRNVQYLPGQKRIKHSLQPCSCWFNALHMHCNTLEFTGGWRWTVRCHVVDADGAEHDDKDCDGDCDGDFTIKAHQWTRIRRFLEGISYLLFDFAMIVT